MLPDEHIQVQTLYKFVVPDSINLGSLPAILLFRGKVTVERNKRSFINSSGLVEVVNGARVLGVVVARGTLPLGSTAAEVDVIAAYLSEDTLDSDNVSPGAQGIAADCSADTQASS